MECTVVFFNACCMQHQFADEDGVASSTPIGIIAVVHEAPIAAECTRRLGTVVVEYQVPVIIYRPYTAGYLA